jgi:hypothetical protein
MAPVFIRWYPPDVSAAQSRTAFVPPVPFRDGTSRNHPPHKTYKRPQSRYFPLRQHATAPRSHPADPNTHVPHRRPRNARPLPAPLHNSKVRSTGRPPQQCPAGGLRNGSIIPGLHALQCWRRFRASPRARRQSCESPGRREAPERNQPSGHPPWLLRKPVRLLHKSGFQPESQCPNGSAERSRFRSDRPSPAAQIRGQASGAQRGWELSACRVH